MASLLKKIIQLRATGFTALFRTHCGRLQPNKAAKMAAIRIAGILPAEVWT
jgi:hypothetical protein